MRLGQGAVEGVGRRGEACEGGLLRRRAGLGDAVAGARDRPERLGDGLRQAVAAKRLTRVGHVGQRLLGPTQERAAADQLLLLARARIEPVELGEAGGQFLTVGVGAGGGGAERLRGPLRLAPRLPRGGGLAGERGQAAVSVEQAAVRAAVEQADSLVLAVDLEQQGAEFAQGAHAGGLVVDHRRGCGRRRPGSDAGSAARQDRRPARAPPAKPRRGDRRAARSWRSPAPRPRLGAPVPRRPSRRSQGRARRARSTCPPRSRP